MSTKTCRQYLLAGAALFTAAAVLAVSPVRESERRAEALPTATAAASTDTDLLLAQKDRQAQTESLHIAAVMAQPQYDAMQAVVLEPVEE